MEENNNTQYIINKTYRPSSYEFGKASNRMKIYFDSPKDLKNQLDELKALGLYMEQTE